MKLQSYPSDLIWACATAIDRINNGYVKEPKISYVYDDNDNLVDSKTEVLPNKVLLKQWLVEGDFTNITEDDYTMGRQYRKRISSYVMKALTQPLNDFQRTSLKVAQMEEFTNKDLLELSIVSCLPAAARREERDTEIKTQKFYSTKLDADVGDSVTLELVVVKKVYSREYDKFIITGRTSDSFVSFWIRHNLDLDSTVKVSGRVKKFLDDDTAMLNFVRLK